MSIGVTLQMLPGSAPHKSLLPFFVAFWALMAFLRPSGASVV